MISLNFWILDFTKAAEPHKNTARPGWKTVGIWRFRNIFSLFKSLIDANSLEKRHNRSQSGDSSFDNRITSHLQG